MHEIDVLFRVVSLPLYFVAQEDATLKRRVLLPAQPPRLVKVKAASRSAALRKNNQRLFKKNWTVSRSGEYG
jgi:hypothetical protein